MAKTILIVDDSSSVRQQVSKALTGAGFKVAEAADGQEGLAMVGSNRDIDMVICDVNMPVMDGIEMVEKVKRAPENKSLPILMLTTEGQVSLVRQARKAGAVGWIVKPFQHLQLLQTVYHLTRRLDGPSEGVTSEPTERVV
jgi:two-component system chemotaxis response regulator CheY